MENQKPRARQKSLSLMDMSSAFVVLAFGLSLAFIVFLLELISSRIKKTETKRINPDRPLAEKRQSLPKVQTPIPTAANQDIENSIAIKILDNNQQPALKITSKPIKVSENYDAITLAPLSRKPSNEHMQLAGAPKEQKSYNKPIIATK